MIIVATIEILLIVLFYFGILLETMAVLAALVLAALLICPRFFITKMNWLIIRFIYKLKIVGDENIPQSGGAILVCNHVSYFDPLILAAVIKRPVRFLVYERIANKPLIKPLTKLMRVIPIPAKCTRESLKSLGEAAQAVRNGELIVIFAEGHVQRVGNMLPFTSGFRWIRKNSDAPVIPVYLDKVWGIKCNLFNSNIRCTLPQEIPYPMTVAFGAPIKEAATPYEARRAVQELGADVACYRKEVFGVLPLAFLKTASRSPFRFAMANANGFKLNYLQVLAAALLLSRKLKKELRESSSKFVGVMLPPSVQSTLTNIALYFVGKIPVNLNYTVPDEFIESVKKQTGMETIITARELLNKLGKQPSESMLFVEDIIERPERFKKLCYEIITLLFPRVVLEKLFFSDKPSRDDLATLIFSSGSTGEPKGVMLSHYNITSNAEAFISALSLNRKDGLMAILPFFHSFGYTVALWMPILAGFKVVYHHNPFEAATIGKAIEEHKLSLLIGTPTFIANYIKKCTKEQFASLKTIVSGAEKLKGKVAVDFYQKFGLNIYEGYGCTETAPVVSVNLHDVSGYWKGQVGFKEGTVGRPMPQITVKVVDITTGQELGANQEGLLYVKGPNVMMGYYQREDLTKEVVKDSWYCTGDIAVCDADGFIHITDRLNRFSKIAGEMIPHIKSEEILHEILDRIDRVCVVMGVPDAKRGERLVVLHILDDIDPRMLSKQLAERGLPNIWIPKPEDYYRVDHIPLLGSGKLDLKGSKQLALEVATKD
ncbi:MAG: AMP-binding protein [Bdellovibrionota bacterium]|jgi:acyl-[acyl-carrier-protein]-phospholipid O-acyltransferase/long-chain-fatty-acid--[acyl-carrier-protein] ligase